MALIVICERCDTRFQLDDARVPLTGARVRCSRCKHGFLVLPPDASDDAAVHAIAAATADAEAPTPFGVSQELSAPDAADEAPATGAAGSVAEEESEWQFAEPPRPEPARPRKEEPALDLWEDVLEPEKPPEALELDALGSPESWSFVSEEAPPLHRPRPAAGPEVPATRTGAGTPVVLGRLRAPAPAVVEPAPEPLPPPRLLTRIGWALTGVLLLAIVHGIDWDGPAPRAAAGPLPLRDGLVAQDLSLQRLENLVAGPILVVAGTVVNPGPQPAGGAARLRARLVGAGGGAEAEAGPPRSADALRESPPEALQGGSPLLAGRLEPGATVPFEAVIAPAPAGALRVELRWEPASGSPPGAGEAGWGAESQAPATGDPSPPTPLPSSG